MRALALIVLLLIPSAADADERNLIDREERLTIAKIIEDLQLRDFNSFRRRAALLHTDAAMLGSPTRVTEPPQDRRGRAPAGTTSVIVRSLDGQLENYEMRSLNWDLAMDALDSLPISPQRDPRRTPA